MIIGLNFDSIILHDKDVSKKIMTIFAEYIITILTILNAYHFLLKEHIYKQYTMSLVRFIPLSWAIFFYSVP